ncbi:hypothetical protein M0D21_09505 [Aquimarina sp. D1M17]|uniref:hypothetical protein n=1 Tax=Aquimarina acroporae TaxID=2937283 RepID=UPI0020C03777|nr:hypothetical protein [Aquimarina acroporae]MCK8521807.1 hypothetical protein [Aquimarina acroporae]
MKTITLEIFTLFASGLSFTFFFFIALCYHKPEFCNGEDSFDNDIRNAKRAQTDEMFSRYGLNIILLLIVITWLFTREDFWLVGLIPLMILVPLCRNYLKLKNNNPKENKTVESKIKRFHALRMFFSLALMFICVFAIIIGLDK